MHHIYFIRHAESHANLLPAFNNAGRDDPLTKTGILQAKSTAKWLCAIDIQAIYSSPIQRAIETAKILSQPAQKPIHILPELKEFNLGNLEEQPQNESNLTIHRQVLNA
jgi:broad specificity phosphatase PhoE